jgi:hypothetical protein
MIRFLHPLDGRLGGADQGWHRRVGARRRADDGLVLLESIVTIGLATIVMAALTPSFVNANSSTNYLRAARRIHRPVDRPGSGKARGDSFSGRRVGTSI